MTSILNFRALRLSALISLVLLCLSACGIKGPLTPAPKSADAAKPESSFCLIQGLIAVENRVDTLYRKESA